MEEMGRLNRIAEFWGWLPAFRAVAETEHVGRAAKKVYRSPSSLSRAVSLLEENLGVALFEKSGRRIQLTEAGQQFLRIVRRAMRLVDDGMVQVMGADLRSQLYIQSAQWLGWIIDHSAGALVARTDEGELEFVTSDRELKSERLLDGEIDILLTHVPIAREELDTHNIATLANALYVRADHPILKDASAQSWTPERLRGCGFVAPVRAAHADTPEEWPRDGWPREFRRDVQCTVDRPELAAQIVCHTDLVGALPALLVEETPQLRDAVVRLPSAFLLETPVFAVRRERLVEEDLTQQVIEHLAELTLLK